MKNSNEMLFKRSLGGKNPSKVPVNFLKREKERCSVRFSRRLRRLPPVVINVRTIPAKRKVRKMSTKVENIEENSSADPIMSSYYKLSSEDCGRNNILARGSMTNASVNTSPRRRPIEKFSVQPSKQKIAICRTKSKLISTHSDLNYKNRKDYVMNILNKGSTRDIEKLYTIGSKTAEKIFLYRQVRGSFEDVSVLRDLPSWNRKRYHKFLKDNYLKCDKSF